MKIGLASKEPDISEGRWYELRASVTAKISAIEGNSDDEIIEECRQLLEDAVRIRLCSDVPVAVSLSGGLDSSTIAAMAGHHIPDLRGFCYGSPVALESEGPIVDRFSRLVGIDVKYIWPNHGANDLDSLLERTLHFRKLLLEDSACWPRMKSSDAFVEPASKYCWVAKEEMKYLPGIGSFLLWL